MRDAWLAYDRHPLHKAWLMDDYLTRHWQWVFRSSDHADLAQNATPPSATDDGVGSDPPVTPADRSPN
jgi:hypothetical protein